MGEEGGVVIGAEDCSLESCMRAAATGGHVNRARWDDWCNTCLSGSTYGACVSKGAERSDEMRRGFCSYLYL